MVEKRGTTVVHSRMLERKRVDAAGMAVGCTGYLTVAEQKRGAWHMAEKEGRSSGTHCTVLHDAVRGGAAAVDGCSDSN